MYTLSLSLTHTHTHILSLSLYVCFYDNILYVLYMCFMIVCKYIYVYKCLYQGGCIRTKYDAGRLGISLITLSLSLSHVHTRKCTYIYTLSLSLMIIYSDMCSDMYMCYNNDD